MTSPHCLIPGYEMVSDRYRIILRTTPMAVALVMALVSKVQAKDVFNIHALELDRGAAVPSDLTHFESGEQAPGTYRVDVYINGELQDTRDITFVRSVGGRLEPELTPTDLDSMGVQLASLPALQKLPRDTTVTDLTSAIPQATTEFLFSQQKLLITVPQANMRLSAQGAVAPKLWSEGVPAALINYSFTGANTWQEEENGHDDSYFLSLRSGLNLGGWRLRNYSTWNYVRNGTRSPPGDDPGRDDADDPDNRESHWDSIHTWLQHDIPRIRGQFTAGDSYTSSDVFDSIQFRGAQIASDDNMLPDSLRGFAPTVRGIASSNAQVTIRQNGSVIYQSYVPPGPFVINDLYPTSSSGDLRVSIKEADGSERTFVQPFSNVPVMQREGRLKYAFTLGKYRAGIGGVAEPDFGQTTLIYGLPYDITLYSGLQIADDRYRAMAAGMGFSLGELGSLAVDATQANTDLQNRKQEEGQSYRLQYSKDVATTDSTVTLAGYRYSTKGFYTFQEALDYQAYDEGTFDNRLQNNKRSKIQLDLVQNLMGGDWGSLSFSGYQQDYWDIEGYERNLSLGYSHSWEGISWTLMYTYTKTADGGQDNNQQYALNVSIPLSRWLSDTWMNMNINTDKHGLTRAQAGMSGTALADNNLSWSAAEGYGNHGEGNNGTASLDYKGTYGETTAGYNYNPDSHQVNYGVQGSVIAHPHGVTLGQQASDMAALSIIRAPGASGVKVQNNTGVYTDWRGYAVVPYLSPYRQSRIALDPLSLSEDVDMEQNVQNVVPTAGAVVIANFKTHVGSRVLMHLTHSGKSLPFGTLVSLQGDTENTGIVGEAGDVYLSGIPDEGIILSRWGDSPGEQCQGSFSLPANNNPSHGLLQINVKCE